MPVLLLVRVWGPSWSPSLASTGPHLTPALARPRPGVRAVPAEMELEASEETQRVTSVQTNDSQMQHHPPCLCSGYILKAE